MTVVTHRPPAMRLSAAISFAAAAMFCAAGFAQDAVEHAFVIDASTDRTPLHTVIPAYPQRALRDRIQGEVEVCFEVDRAGRTSRIAVRRSSHRLFEKPSISAIRESTYKALPEEQRLSGIKTCRTFRFQLNPVNDQSVPSRVAEP